MPTARKWMSVCVALAFTTVSCTKSSSTTTEPSNLMANMELRFTPDPVVQASVGACVNPSTGQVFPPGPHRVFLYSFRVEETSDVGLILQFANVSVLMNGVFASIRSYSPGSIADRFTACGGSGGRLEASQTRCSQPEVFCLPLGAPIPPRIQVEVRGLDDNGNSITALAGADLSVPE